MGVEITALMARIDDGDRRPELPCRGRDLGTETMAMTSSMTWPDWRGPLVSEGKKKKRPGRCWAAAGRGRCRAGSAWAGLARLELALFYFFLFLFLFLIFCFPKYK